MLSRIKAWCYAIAVCKKYKLIWNPFVKLEGGYYSYKGVIGVNPFDSYFMSTFLHEVGHHVHNKRVPLKNYLKAQDGELRFLNGNEAWRAKKHDLALQYAEMQSDPRVAEALKLRYLYDEV